MAHSLEDKLRGVSITELLTSISSLNSDIYVKIFERDARGSYSITVMRKGLISKIISIGLFVKSSNKRRSPWQYSFHREHQEEIEQLKKAHDKIFVLFLNGDDGVACINNDQLKEILDDDFEDFKGVRVSRKLREAYRVSGRDGKLSSPLPKNSFPNSIIEWIKTQL